MNPKGKGREMVKIFRSFDAQTTNNVMKQESKSGCNDIKIIDKTTQSETLSLSSKLVQVDPNFIGDFENLCHDYGYCSVRPQTLQRKVSDGVSNSECPVFLSPAKSEQCSSGNEYIHVPDNDLSETEFQSSSDDDDTRSSPKYPYVSDKKFTVFVRRLDVLLQFCPVCKQAVTEIDKTTT